VFVELRRSLPIWTTAVYASANTARGAIRGWYIVASEISPDVRTRCRIAPVAYRSIKCCKIIGHTDINLCSRILETRVESVCASNRPKNRVPTRGGCHAIAYHLSSVEGTQTCSQTVLYKRSRRFQIILYPDILLPGCG
jgi:hypothetical protein